MPSPREQVSRGAGRLTRLNDPRVTTRPSDVRSGPDPRVTTFPTDLRRRRPHLWRHPSHDAVPHSGPYHDFPAVQAPGPYHDYVNLDRWGWWPRWYPYWDPSWRTYWRYLYDYYGGDQRPDYAAYARDVILRQYGRQWGLTVDSGSPGVRVGIQPYGGQFAVERSPMHGGRQLSSYRDLALDQARRIQEATGRTFIGYRDSPWGGELTMFGTRAGLQRWSIEQANDTAVWYAATFDLAASATPLSEVRR